MGPNPFDSHLLVKVQVARAERTSVEVFDRDGRRVRTLSADPVDGGEVSLRWDGRNEAGRSVVSGLYVLRIRAGGVERQAKVVRLK